MRPMAQSRRCSRPSASPATAKLVKPYHVLSGGERFRCRWRGTCWAMADVRWQMAEVKGWLCSMSSHRSLIAPSPKVGSAAVSKAHPQVAVAVLLTICHLPSHIYHPAPLHRRHLPLRRRPLAGARLGAHMATGELKRGWLRRPDIVLEVVQCPQKTWGLFEPSSLSERRAGPLGDVLRRAMERRAGRVLRHLRHYGRLGRKRVTRIVVLSDYQGLGIGRSGWSNTFVPTKRRKASAAYHGGRPAVIDTASSPPYWETVGIKRATGSPNKPRHGLECGDPCGKCVVSFELQSSHHAPRGEASASADAGGKRE